MYRPKQLKVFTTIKRPDRRNKPHDSFYDSKAWRDLRKAYLTRNPLCVHCRESGRVAAATTVHHKLERETHPELSLAWDNLEGICRACHNRLHNRFSNDSGQ